MKSASFDNVTVNQDGTFTITGKITDATFSSGVQRVSISHFPASDQQSSITFQISNQAVFLKRFGSDSFAVPLSEFAKLGTAVVPTLNPPKTGAKPADAAKYPLPKPAPQPPPELLASIGAKPNA